MASVAVTEGYWTTHTVTIAEKNITGATNLVQKHKYWLGMWMYVFVCVCVRAQVA